MSFINDKIFIFNFFMIIFNNMAEKEPTIEYEPQPEKDKETPESKSPEKESRPDPEYRQKKKDSDKKKEKEIEEKKTAYKEEINQLIDLAKQEGFSEAYKKAKKMSKEKDDSIIIDLFHDRLSQENLDD